MTPAGSIHLRSSNYSMPLDNDLGLRFVESGSHYNRVSNPLENVNSLLFDSSGVVYYRGFVFYQYVTPTGSIKTA